MGRKKAWRFQSESNFGIFLSISHALLLVPAPHYFSRLLHLCVSVGGCVCVRVHARVRANVHVLVCARKLT